MSSLLVEHKPRIVVDQNGGLCLVAMKRRLGLTHSSGEDNWWGTSTIERADFGNSRVKVPQRQHEGISPPTEAGL